MHRSQPHHFGGSFSELAALNVKRNFRYGKCVKMIFLTWTVLCVAWCSLWWTSYTISSIVTWCWVRAWSRTSFLSTSTRFAACSIWRPWSPVSIDYRSYNKTQNIKNQSYKVSLWITWKFAKWTLFSWFHNSFTLYSAFFLTQNQNCLHRFLLHLLNKEG